MMGRAKKRKKPVQPGFSAAEIELRELCHDLDYTLPRQLDKWRDHFLDEKRFIQAAEKWLELKINGVAHPRIEDDIDKGHMRRKHTVIQSQDWDDDWYWGHIPGYHSAGLYQPIQKTISIPAPVGIGGLNMATVF